MFWAPAVVLVLALTASLFDFDDFLAAATAANEWILAHFDWLFSVATFAAVALVALIFVSPLGAVRIGGKAATPILAPWSWFSITLCTTIAIGILFWGTTEPIFHVIAPPAFAGVEAGSDEARRFALSALYLHWTVTPYALYTVPALAFALAFHNLGRPYSVGSATYPHTDRNPPQFFCDAIDAFSLFALVAGVAAALGAGVLSLTGGLKAAFGVDDSPALRLVLVGMIVGAFVASSASGLHRGIRVLSDINAKAFFALAAFIFTVGPTGEMLARGGQAFIDYVAGFVPASLNLDGRAGDPWTRSWTVFSFAQWLAWAPITALFLGRIAVGYSVRAFILVNLMLPALFGMIWMTVFGASAIEIDSRTGALSAALKAGGPEAVVYAMFAALPLAGIVQAVFVGLVFISFVTAMDSTTHSVAEVCLKRAAPGGEHGPLGLRIKIFWGVLIGLISWTMTATTGVAGVRMLSNLGGLPGVLILIGSGGFLARLIVDRRSL
ncbi:MAG: BCCT family transporter [Pseudomonadota bacterium]|nr:BCCT family transporter [Pseudomonadota bacterium]